MENGKNINVDMYRVKNSPMPFIQVDYTDSYGIVRTGILLLETAANVNLLSKEYGFSFLKDKGNTDIKILSPDGSIEDTVKFSFMLDGKEFEDEFLVKNHLFTGYDGVLPLIGVIGNVFLQNNNLVIDYSNHMVYTSKFLESEIDVLDYDFYFPMEIGLKNYSMPTVPLVQNKWEIRAVVQTGKIDNHLSSSTLCTDGLQCEYQDYQSLALFMSKCIDTLNVTMDYGLLTVIDEEGHVGDVCFKGDFEVNSHYYYTPKPGELNDDGELLEPIEAVIGADFMEKEEWILDFGIDIIYKNKQKCYNREIAS